MTAAAYDRKHYYRGERAATYDASRIGQQSSPLARFRWQQEMRGVEQLAAEWPRGTVVLDSPCGTGRFFPVLARCGHRVVGADISDDMLGAIPPGRRSTEPVHVLRGDIERLPLRDASIDIVLAMRVWSFLSDSARRAALSQWRRIARRNIHLQVRFRCVADDSLPVGAITSSATQFDGRGCESIDPQQRANWPTRYEFEVMAKAAALQIVKYHPLDWGPTDDPVMIVALDHCAIECAPCGSRCRQSFACFGIVGKGTRSNVNCY